MALATRYAGIQDKLKGIDDFGCHFLVLCSIAEEALQWKYNNPKLKVDLIDAVNIAYDKRLINFEYEVQHNCDLLKELTGFEWKETRGLKELPKVIKDNEFTECIYKNPRNNYVHYRRRSVDTLINSVTVKEGRIIEYRIYELLNKV